MDIILLQYFLGNLGLLFPGSGPPAAVVLGTATPNNADGYPDGTVYIQTL